MSWGINRECNLAGMQNIFLTVMIFGSMFVCSSSSEAYQDSLHHHFCSRCHVEAGGLTRPEEVTARAKTCIWQYIGELQEREKALIQQQARESISMKKQLSLPPLFTNMLSAENLSKMEHCSSEETDALLLWGRVVAREISPLCKDLLPRLATREAQGFWRRWQVRLEEGKHWMI